MSWLSSLGKPVSTKVPTPRPAEFVTVLRTGGALGAAGVQGVELRFEAWAGDEIAASELIGEVVASVALAGGAQLAAGVWCTAVQHGPGPRNDPDDQSGQARYSWSATLWVRPGGPPAAVAGESVEWDLLQALRTQLTGKGISPVLVGDITSRAPSAVVGLWPYPLSVTDTGAATTGIQVRIRREVAADGTGLGDLARTRDAVEDALRLRQQRIGSVLVMSMWRQSSSGPFDEGAGLLEVRDNYHVLHMRRALR